MSPDCWRTHPIGNLNVVLWPTLYVVTLVIVVRQARIPDSNSNCYRLHYCHVPMHDCVYSNYLNCWWIYQMRPHRCRCFFDSIGHPFCRLCPIAPNRWMLPFAHCRFCLSTWPGVFSSVSDVAGNVSYESVPTKKRRRKNSLKIVSSNMNENNGIVFSTRPAKWEGKKTLKKRKKKIICLQIIPGMCRTECEDERTMEWRTKTRQIVR